MDVEYFALFSHRYSFFFRYSELINLRCYCCCKSGVNKSVCNSSLPQDVPDVPYAVRIILAYDFFQSVGCDVDIIKDCHVGVIVTAF